MKLSNIFFLLIAFVQTSAQLPASIPSASKIKWLVGSWKGVSNNIPFYEAWRGVNDSTLVNFSIEIKNRDTIVRMADHLIFRNNTFFLGKLPNQWKGLRLTDTEIVLANDSLKFSNRIIWLHTKDDHWFTILEHPARTVYYDLTRIPELEKHVDKIFLQSKQVSK
ncbi:MAG TPA: hypothetical protein VM012_06045 [Flavitalea sp.]|nr:hypothetical protein [Flavitalea sp.]